MSTTELPTAEAPAQTRRPGGGWRADVQAEVPEPVRQISQRAQLASVLAKAVALGGIAGV